MPGRSQVGKHIEVSRFAQKFVENGGDATDAVLSMRTMKEPSARKRGKDLLKRKEVREQIYAYMEKAGIDIGYTLGMRKKIVDHGMKDLKEMRITAADVHNHLSGMEKVFLTLEEHSMQREPSRIYVANLGFTQAIGSRSAMRGTLQDVQDATVAPLPQVEEDK